MTLKNDLLLRAARRERTERTPVWLMRQAGRFDPAYRELRERTNLPLEDLFRHPELAAEISLLPKRYGVDAIIFFQDILTPLAPMGAPFVFRPGPKLTRPVRSAADVHALHAYDPVDELEFVPATLKRVRDALGGDLPLLGFAGAPLTLAFFILESGSPGSSPRHALAMMNDEPALFHDLLGRLADTMADYLAMQIEAGVDAVQLFESCADLLTPEAYREFAHPYHERIFSKLPASTPKILFARDRTEIELMASSGADVLSLCARVDLADARRRVGDRVALQGNVDNHMLAQAPLDQVESAVKDCVRAGEHTGHILNLSHGLLKETPVENVRCLIDTCQAISSSSPSPQVEAKES